MADLTAVRTALASQIQAKALPKLSHVYAQPMDAVNIPCALIFPSRTNVARYGITLGEGLVTVEGVPYAPAEFSLEVLVLVSRSATIERVQQELDQWLGFETSGNTISIAGAIAIDPTLGGTVDYCEANAVTQYGPVEYNGNMYFGARITVTTSTQ